MTHEIEIEFKQLLTKEQFEQIKNDLPFSPEAITQTNYYFETKDEALIRNKCALRIRKKNESYTATLKEPHPEGILETHDSLSEEEANTWINDHITFTTNVGKRLDAHHIPLETIKYIGALTTERYTYTKNKLLYVLDMSRYGNVTDYELEIEAQNYADGEAAHKQMIDTFHLPNLQPITKIERFLQSIKHSND